MNREELEEEAYAPFKMLQHITLKFLRLFLKWHQGTINCAILASGIGGSGDPRRKWESERGREREKKKRKVLLLFAK